MENNKSLGKIYENLAEEYLINNGYIIKCRNYQVRQAEIDIVAYDKKEKTLCFVEVKYRRSERAGNPLEAVGIAKQKQISKAALFYMNQNKINPDNIYIRFDVIGICGKNDITHIKNAFDYIR